MKNRATYLIIACILAILLASVSCASSPQAPAATAPGSTKAAASPTTAGAKTAPAPTAAPKAEAPKYGGTITMVLNSDPTNFDAGTKGQGGGPTYSLVLQQYMSNDFLRGPAGGGPMDALVAGTTSVEELYFPQVAESWKMPSVGVWVMQVRKGMKWQKIDSEAGKLMAGREVTADDVVKSLKRLLTAPQSWANVGQPNMAKATTIEKTGDWEVTIKTPVDYLTSFFWIIQGGGFNALYPPEVVDKFGDVADWKNIVGTGPYMITDYTKGSSLTYNKNPDYWETDPAGPGKGNKLPYADQVRQLVIPDVSSRLAALRTGKIDLLTDATTEDAQTVIKDNPQIKYLEYMTGAINTANTTYGISMRTDKKDLPFSDKRVRQAMVLATDFNGLKQTLFGGKAETDVWPVNKQLKALYQPMSEMPQAVQDLYKYNPEKAKQLLAEAGFPNGFKTSVVVQNDPQLIDELSVFKEQWAKVGINLTIDPRENAAFTALMNARGNDELIYRAMYTTMPIVLYFSPYRGKSTNNPSYINDPEGSHPALEEIFKEANANVFTDWNKAYGAYKKMKPILLEEAYLIPRPTPYVYSMWWPWLKNYYGQPAAGLFLKYAWVDQDLKKSMGK